MAKKLRVFKQEWLRPPASLTNDQLGQLKAWLQQHLGLMPKDERDKAKLLLAEVVAELRRRRAEAREDRVSRKWDEKLMRNAGMNVFGTKWASHINLQSRRAWFKVPRRDEYVAGAVVGGQVGWILARVKSSKVEFVAPMPEPQGVKTFKAADPQTVARIEAALPSFVTNA